MVTAGPSEVVSPREPFAGEYPVPGFDVTRRWVDGHDLTDDMRSQVLKLLEVAFNGAPSWYALPVDPADHFDWKYRDYPLGASPTFNVEADGRIVGFIGRGRRVWYIDGEPHVGRWGYDHCSHPEMQGRGLQRALESGRAQEYHPAEEFVFGEYGHPVDRRLAIERGAIAPANRTNDYLRILNPFTEVRARVRTLRSRRRAAAGAGGSSVSRTARQIRRSREGRFASLLPMARLGVRYVKALLARRRPRGAGAWTISTLDRFEERHEAAIDEAVRQFDFVAERSIEYLNWRLLDERAGPFVVRQATDAEGAFVGYAATRVLDGRASLADVLVKPGHADAAEALIRDALDLARAAGCSSMQVRLPERHLYTPALRRAGFVSLGHVAGEIAISRDADTSHLAALRREDVSVHYVLADVDFV